DGDTAPPESRTSYIYRNGVPTASAPRLSYLGPIVKSAIWQLAVNAYPFLFYLHAGVVSTGSGCVLLPAAPGSGKSSLTAALTHRGYGYFSDEIALISRDTFLVPPVPLAICVKESGWALIGRYYPELFNAWPHHRYDGKDVRYLPPPKRAGDLPPMPVRHII